MTEPIITFCMPLKNRSQRALASLRSLLAATEGFPVALAICEDFGNDLLKIEGGKPHCPVAHYVVESGSDWNRSALLNFSFKRAASPLLATWDADFRFPADFGKRIMDHIESTNFDAHYIQIQVTERNSGVKDARPIGNGSLWGGLYIYEANKVADMDGYDEGFQGHGHEELDFNDRYVQIWKVKPRVISIKGYVDHLAHSVKLSGNQPKSNIALRDRNRSEGKIENVKWGEMKIVKENRYG